MPANYGRCQENTQENTRIYVSYVSWSPIAVEQKYMDLSSRLILPLLQIGRPSRLVDRNPLKRLTAPVFHGHETRKPLLKEIDELFLQEEFPFFVKLSGPMSGWKKLQNGLWSAVWSNHETIQSNPEKSRTPENGCPTNFLIWSKDVASMTLQNLDFWSIPKAKAPFQIGLPLCLRQWTEYLQV